LPELSGMQLITRRSWVQIPPPLLEGPGGRKSKGPFSRDGGSQRISCAEVVQPARGGRMGRVQRQRQSVHPAIATAAALGSVAAAVVAVLAFVVGVFDDEENGSSNPELTGTSEPVIESLVHVPPSALDAAGVSGPVSEGKAIFLVARRPKSGELVASAAAKFSESSSNEDQLHWRALLDLGTTGVSFAGGSDEAQGAYEVVAAVMPKSTNTSASSGSSGPWTNFSTGASADGLDLDDAQVVSSPRTITIP
jgi:hypothetical protein